VNFIILRPAASLAQTGRLLIDGDGSGGNSDAFPSSPSEPLDSDGGGIGDNSDAFPSESTATADTESDRVGDNGDAFPSDPGESADNDGDGVGGDSNMSPNARRPSVRARLHSARRVRPPESPHHPQQARHCHQHE